MRCYRYYRQKLQKERKQAMQQKIIGILGIGGYLGKYAAEKLLKCGYKVLGAQRKEETLFGGYENFTFESLDIGNSKQLDEFILRCHVVVNCVSPSHLYGKIVKDAVCKWNKIYVDPSDMSFEKDREKIEGKCVGSCGYIPGFSEFLAYTAAKKDFEKVSRCMMYQGGFDGCSPGAFVDMILGAGNKNFYGDSYISGSKLLPLSFDIRKKHMTPFSDKPFIFKPLINSDNINLQKKIDADEFYFFSAYDDMDTMKFFMRLLLDVSKYSPELAAQNIKRKLEERIKSNHKFGSQKVEAFLFFELEGKEGNVDKTITCQVILKNVNKVCGYFLAEAVDEVMRHPEKISEGFNYGSEIVDSGYLQRVMGEIGEEGAIKIEETCK
ncbi:MAG: NAD-dependent epimerase/dehydratase family protein [Muricomes sp.]